MLIGGAGLLTARAWWDDHYGPDAAGYRQAVADAEMDAERAAELGRRRHSARRGDFAGPPRSQDSGPQDICRPVCPVPRPPLRTAREDGEPAARRSARRLAGFASREWLAGLLDPKQIDGPDYFGPTSHHDGDMVNFVKENIAEWKPRTSKT